MLIFVCLKKVGLVTGTTLVGYLVAGAASKFLSKAGAGAASKLLGSATMYIQKIVCYKTVATF
jgi:hypothetical protein